MTLRLLLYLLLYLLSPIYTENTLFILNLFFIGNIDTVLEVQDLSKILSCLKLMKVLV